MTDARSRSGNAARSGNGNDVAHDTIRRDLGTGGGTGPGHPAPARESVSQAALWFGLFGGAAAWSIQLLANYSISAHECYPRLIPLADPLSGQSALIVPLIVISVIAVLIALAALAAAIVTWRQTSAETGGPSHWLLDTGEGRTRFMAAAAIMASSVFLLGILFHFAAVLLLGHC